MKHLITAAVSASLISCGTYETASTKPTAVTAAEMERQEFKELYKKDSLEKRNMAAASLNVLLNDDPDNKLVSVIVKNTSPCDIILRFAGQKPYNLPIKKNDKNFLVIEKGEYYLGANMCHSRFSSSRNFTDSITLTISEKE